MQVDGMREFFSRFAPPNGTAGVQGNASLSVLPAPARQTQPPIDTLFLSSIGKGLNLNARESVSLIEKRKDEITDPLLKLMDKSMLQLKDILERMHELTTIAQNKKLSDLDRVNLQIEIEDLRTNITPLAMSLMSQYRGGPAVAGVPDIREGILFSGDGSSMLGRMQERIIKGEKWDVREAWSPYDLSGVTHDDGGEPVGEFGGTGAWHVVGDKNVLTSSKEGKIVDSGGKVPTVRERLEAGSPVVVMDAESADRGVQYLEQQMDSVQKWRDVIAEMDASENASALDKEKLLHNVYDYFHKTELATWQPFTGVDYPGYFLYGGEVYDHQYVIRDLAESGGGDIPLTEGEIIKNYLVGAGLVDKNDRIRIYGYSGPKLLTGEEVSLEEAKIVYLRWAGEAEPELCVIG